MTYERPDSQRASGGDEFAQRLATIIKETFYAYGIRDSSDNRSAQRHLGPSEIGTPCDRRLAMELLGMARVNPGGDGYAAWLGTQGHRGMADIYEWADGRSGRYAVETPLHFASKFVPRGTGDLLDRRERTFIDWKFMGHSALKKLRSDGPSAVYRTQIHTYGYGAVQRGEKVEHVAIVGMPRQGYSLDEMYVWSEPFNPTIAEVALERVARIGEQVTGRRSTPQGDGFKINADAEVAKSFATAKDCTYCPFHLPGAPDLQYGCDGKG